MYHKSYLLKKKEKRNNISSLKSEALIMIWSVLILYTYKHIALGKLLGIERKSGLGSESSDKYKANKDYFYDVKGFVSDSKVAYNSLLIILKQ